MASIAWNPDFEEALSEAGHEGKLLMASIIRPGCGGCQRLEKETFSDERVAAAVREFCVPFKAGIEERPDVVRRIRVNWTPTTLFLDGERVEHHRLVGFMAPDEFTAQIHFAVGRRAFNHGHYDEAIQRLLHVTEQFPQADCAPEAMYWRGVSEYKKAGKPDGMIAIWKELYKKYPKSIWAKKVEHAAAK